MARINIEDAIYKDIRFIQLIQKLGSIDSALGALVRAWSLAQAHYLSTKSDRLIPLSEWKRQFISDEIINVGLAEVREKGVYVCGAERQFAWLVQRYEAGKKGGRPKSGSKPTESDRLATASGSKRLEPSYSSSISLEEGEEEPSPKKKSSVQRFEAQFNPEAQRLLQGLDELGIKSSVKNYLPEILDRFEKYEEFRDWVNPIYQSKENEIRNEAAMKRYITVALKKEIGVLREADAG